MRKLLVALFCTSLLVANVPIKPITTQGFPPNTTVTDVEKAIAAASAASAPEWTLSPINEGTIEAKLIVRSHKLVVDIAYTATECTIKYKSSVNLNYNKEKQTIHNNYNQWLWTLSSLIHSTLWKEWKDAQDPPLTVASVDELPRASGGWVLAEPVTSAVPVSLTAHEVGKAIAVAASKFDWTPKLIEKGTIEATLPIRKHELVVDITYTATEYTIKYKSSKNLGYDKRDNTIHKNYKEWLQNLDTGIQRALQATAIQRALSDSSGS